MNPYPSPSNLGFVEDLLNDYARDPQSVDPAWRSYFDALRDGEPPQPTRPGPVRTSIFHGGGTSAPSSGVDTRQELVDQLIRAYRVHGHSIAQLDPLGLHNRAATDLPELDPAYYGLTEKDWDRPFSSRLVAGPDIRTLRDLIEMLRSTYCRFIGAQYMHLDDPRVRRWIQERMELTGNRLRLGPAEQRRVLRRLTEAVVFEEFIQKKFQGDKSFSLEGAESLIPLLDIALERAAEHGAEEVVIGMAHRGRLNVLANIMGKSPREIFREFQDLDAKRFVGGGDVKYHLGYHRAYRTAKGTDLHVALCFNPSHLEFVNPVVLGRVRARQDRMGDTAREKAMAILMHGDAAFAGEGIVQETLNLSELKGYSIGGTLHIVVNNQIGFTTTPSEARSTPYATDIAKMLQSPIFHVNGENPEAVVQVINLAMDFRRTFKRDVFVDMYCFRRRGHNEQDEPAFTQPVMYRAVRERKPLRETYLEHLIASGGEITREEGVQMVEESREHLERALVESRSEARVDAAPTLLTSLWANYRGGADEGVPDPESQFSREELADLLLRTTRAPDGFEVHRTLQRVLERRTKMASGEENLDWGAAEALAFASLAVKGTRIRLSGQDSARGTFSHRHAVLYDQRTGEQYLPLAHLAPGQGKVEIINSPLSEAGVMGFEYGYSIAFPDGLILWEAQFGDFVNTAQVIIDQFISSAEDKWGRLSGLVLLLPHGFEGQGPEHSSGRIERFLELCAEDNMQVCYPSTAGQYYHLLRRQVTRIWRKPLVVMTPKSLLRRQDTNIAELPEGRFERVIADPLVAPNRTRGVLLCSGKIYFELVEEREKRGCMDIAIVRIEQFYPLSNTHLAEAIGNVADGTPVCWVQEEPENMGAWTYLLRRFSRRLLNRYPLSAVARAASASPATGSKGGHKIEQQQLLDEAFAAVGAGLAPATTEV